MNKKFLFMCVLSCISVTSLFSAEQRSKVNENRHEMWGKIAIFPYDNGMKWDFKFNRAISKNPMSYNPETRTLSMGTGVIEGIHDEDMPMVKKIMQEVTEACELFNGQRR